jgi:thiol-disulfide isomerase/thioredoxin
MKRIAALIISCSIAASSLSAQQARPALKPGSPVTPDALSAATWLQGRPLAEFEPDKVYLLECWATWCGPCIATIPHVNQLHETYHNRGLRVIGVNVFEDGVDAVRNFVTGNGQNMSYPVVYTGKGSAFENEWLKPAGIRSIPNSFIIRNGKLVAISHPARLTNAVVEALLDGKDVPELLQKSNPKDPKDLPPSMKLVREIAAAADSGDTTAMESKLRELGKLEPTNPFLPALRIRLHLSRKEWEIASGIFAANQTGLPHMVATGMMVGAITGRDDAKFSRETIKRVLDSYRELSKTKGNRQPPADFAVLSFLNWQCGDHEQARSAADQALAAARSANDPAKYPVESYERFFTAVQQDNPQAMRALWTTEKTSQPSQLKAP